MIKGDVYSNHSILYYDSTNTKMSVYRLLNSAIVYFKSIYRVKNISYLRDYVHQLKNKANPNDLTLARKTLKMTREALLDEIKLGICFENYMKALLLNKGYLIHQINNNMNVENNIELSHLYSKQRKCPIEFSEYHKYDDFNYDSVLKQNTLLYLSEQTINYSLLLNNKKYQSIIDLPDNIINILLKNKKKRNMLHYLTNHWAMYSNGVLTEWIELIDFVNENIINFYNIMAKQNNFNKLKRISPL